MHDVGSFKFFVQVQNFLLVKTNFIEKMWFIIPKVLERQDRITPCSKQCWYP